MSDNYEDSKFFITRHSIKPKGEDVESEQYKGLSRKGVELARSSARNILDDIENSPDNTVVFLGGVSDEVRTRSTMQLYGEELKKALAGRNDYVVITREDVGAGEGLLRKIRAICDANPHKKIIVDAPVYLEELSLRKKGSLTKEGKPTPYLAKLLEMHGNNESEALRDYIRNNGEMDGLKGPNPEFIARSYQVGVERLEKFARKVIGNRPLVTGIVGHSFETDMYLAYVAGGGKVDLPSFEKISSGQGMIKETEKATFKMGHEFTEIDYRGRKTKVRPLEEMLRVGAIMGLIVPVILSFPRITGNTIGTAVSASISVYEWIGLMISIISLIGLLYLKDKD